MPLTDLRETTGDDAAAGRGDAAAVPPPRERRLDARRNLEAIIDAARRTFAKDPRASMQQVAEAAGLHRATVHRHFASRDDLLNALGARAMEESLQALRGARIEEGSAADAVRRATRAFVEITDRWQLGRYTAVYHTGPAVEEMRRLMTALIARGQREGTVRADLGDGVLTTVWAGVLSNAGVFLEQGMSVDEAADVIATVILGGGGR
ncbi:MAG TPA: helix-turn-helix domain-containing protein [Solirubrobacteraceae bacterium]|nr:helix-turn-helix domain-containing protein [Solirubrobacteraceae bacterium]